MRPDFSVLSGWEDLILPSLLAGADGSICAFANVAPELFVELVHASKIGDLGKAAELHRRVLSLVTLGVYSDPPISAIKLAMNKLGVPISSAVRGPALPIPEEAHERSKACSAKWACCRCGRSASATDSGSISEGSNPSPAAPGTPVLAGHSVKRN